MLISEKQKRFVYAFLIAVVFLNTFVLALQRKMNLVITDSGVGRAIGSIAIAISDLEYGLKGYSSYWKIYSSLEKDGLFKDVGILPTRNKKGVGVDEYSKKVNNALKKALNIKDVAANSKYYLLREYKGLVNYYKMSFLLFGYKVQGFCYLYFLILLISVVTFFISFYKRIDLLQFLLLFLCAHFVTVALGAQVVQSQRFLAVLSILPAFHLALLILGKNINKRGLFIGAIVQTFILIFSIHIRGSAKYQLMFLPFLYLSVLGFFYLRNVELGKNVFYKVRFWPLIIVFLGTFLFKIHLVTAMNYPYTSTTSNYLTWFTIYLGMSSHPDSESKYGIIHGDAEGFYAAEKLAPGSYKDDAEHTYVDYDLIESTLKKESLRIITTDPLFYVQSVLYKIPELLKLLFAPKIGFLYYLFSGINIMAIFMGSFLCSNIFSKQVVFFVFLVFLELMFSSIPFLLSDPTLALAQEPILVSAFLLYIVFALFACVILRSLSGIKTLNGNFVNK